MPCFMFKRHHLSLVPSHYRRSSKHLGISRYYPPPRPTLPRVGRGLGARNCNSDLKQTGIIHQHKQILLYNLNTIVATVYQPKVKLLRKQPCVYYMDESGIGSTILTLKTPSVFYVDIDGVINQHQRNPRENKNICEEEDPYMWFYLSTAKVKQNASQFIAIIQDSMILPLHYNKKYVLMILNNLNHPCSLNNWAKELYHIIDCMLLPNNKFKRKNLPINNSIHFLIKQNLREHYFFLLLTLHFRRGCMNMKTPEHQYFVEIFSKEDLYEIISNLNYVNLVKKYIPLPNDNFIQHLEDFMHKSKPLNDKDVRNFLLDIILAKPFHAQNSGQIGSFALPDTQSLKIQLDVIILILTTIHIEMLVKYGTLSNILTSITNTRIK